MSTYKIVPTDIYERIDGHYVPQAGVRFEDEYGIILELPADEWAELEWAVENGSYTDTGEYVYFPDIPGVMFETADFEGLASLVRGR